MNLLSSRTKSYLLRRSCLKASLILAGSVIQGFGMGVFLFPHAIPPGGAGGLALLLNHWFSLPMSIGFWLMNFLFLLTAIRYLGTISTIGTIGVITTTSVSFNIFGVYFTSPFGNVWFDLLAGSVLLGLGIAVLLTQRFSNGGIGFAALALSRQRHADPGKTLLWMNGCIFILTASVIDWMIIIQALLCQWISTSIVSWLYSASFPTKPLYVWRGRKGG